MSAVEAGGESSHYLDRSRTALRLWFARRALENLKEMQAWPSPACVLDIDSAPLTDACATLEAEIAACEAALRQSAESAAA